MISMAEITDACELFTDDTSLDAQLASLLPSDATGALAQNVPFGSACRARAVLASAADGVQSKVHESIVRSATGFVELTSWT